MIMQKHHAFLKPDHLLSTWSAFKSLPAASRALCRYDSKDLWELDTQRLPMPMANLRRRARAFAESVLAPGVRILDEADHAQAGTLHPQAAQVLSEAGRQGWMTGILPVPLGTAGVAEMAYAPHFRYALQVEEFARVDAGQMLLLSAHQLGLAPLLLSMDPKLWWRYLRPMVHDFQHGIPHLFAFAITEPSSGSDVEEGMGAELARPGVVAYRDGKGYRLRGRKCYISGGDLARTLTVFAALEGEPMSSWTCFVVQSDQPGFSCRRTELKMGMRASSAAEIELDDVRIEPSAIVAGLRRGWALNRATLNMSRFPVAAMAVGLARRACELALDFCVQRQLAGKPLLHYQEIQLQLAQMIAQTRAMRSMLWQSASGSFVPRQSEASMVKFLASDQAQEVCTMGLDLLAEVGIGSDCGMEKLLRDVRLIRIFEGTNQINRLAVMEDLQPLWLQSGPGSISC